MNLPPAIEVALTRLGKHKTMTPALQSLMVSIFRNTMRAFDAATAEGPTAIDRDALAKVSRRLDEGKRIAGTAPPGSPDATLLPDLQSLAELLRPYLSPGVSPAAAPAADAALPAPPFAAPPGNHAANASWRHQEPPRWSPAPMPRPAPPAPAPPPPRVRARPSEPPAADPGHTDGLIERLYARRDDLLARRQALLADPIATEHELEAIDGELAALRRATGWIASAGIATGDDAADTDRRS